MTTLALRRLRAALRWDVQLQIRNGFYYAAAFVAGLWLLLLIQMRAFDLAYWLPVLLVSNLLIGTFYFIGGLVLLEKGEGTLAAQVVTPLRSGEYLGAKVLSLTGLALAENVVIVLAARGLNFSPLPLLAGLIVLAALYCLYGFVAVARYPSINEFLLPSVLWTVAAQLPVLGYLNIAPTWLWYLHPLQAPLSLLRAAFQPVPAWEAAYGVLYGALWIGLLGWAARRAYERFVVRDV